MLSAFGHKMHMLKNPMSGALPAKLPFVNRGPVGDQDKSITFCAQIIHFHWRMGNSICLEHYPFFQPISCLIICIILI